MQFSCRVFFRDIDTSEAYVVTTYNVYANDEEEAEIAALELAEDHPAWHWEDTHNVVVTEIE